MTKIIIIFGNITFNEEDSQIMTDTELKLFKTNNPRKALIHSIDKVLECDDNNEAIDKMLYDHETEAWLIPSQYNGEVIYEPNPNATILGLCINKLGNKE
jgi:hypothetical protein